MSYDQYLLNDPGPLGAGPYTAFATGLRTYTGVPKPGWRVFGCRLLPPGDADRIGVIRSRCGVCVRPVTTRRP